jgi:MFS family permease
MSHFAGNRSAFVARAGLTVLCVAQFVVVLDATIVATALPAIGADLGFAPAQLSWVITAYTVVLAGLLILGGRAADLAGARRTFRVGLVVFSVASLACALAWTPAALIGGRIAQGVGAALLSPAALAAVNELIQGPDARRRALGWWTAAGAGGGASGWVLGGLITEIAGWRWVFAVNAPIGLIALLLSLRVLRRPTAAGRATATAAGSLDLGGAISVTAGIGLATLGLSRLAEHAGRWEAWLAIALSAAALVFFVRHEGRAAGPLVPGRLVRRRGVVGGNLTAAALTASTTPAMLTAILYVQHTLRLSPARGSLLFPAFNLAVVAGSLLGPAGLARTGARAMLLGGFGGVVGGIALLLTLPAQGLPVISLVAAFAVMGLGLGAASVASTTAGSAEVTGSERGIAAGLLNSTAQLGTAVGLAVTSPLVASTAPMTGYRLGFGAAALIAVAGAIGALTVPRRASRTGAVVGTPAGPLRHRSRGTAGRSPADAGSQAEAAACEGVGPGL